MKRQGLNFASGTAQKPQLLAQSLQAHFESKRDAILARDISTLLTHYARPLAIYVDGTILLPETDRQMIDYFNAIYEVCIETHSRDVTFEVSRVDASGHGRYRVEATWSFFGDGPDMVLRQSGRYMMKWSPDTNRFRTEIIEAIEPAGSALSQRLKRLDWSGD
ncbi:hypothetical protein [Sulfitobacter sabulilitoris]|uniref:Nuclear transport factor 2 family protein n=1 Tax=Sulfitobacter sabulilitoris TaxID=2562655 RepID=A0A5S3PKJ8_9RHOB|nr:hypothetical protein [Sulfitobacter sabulilitoris]TMM54954.1 hypothetical protein FDT80_05090 [Sulfitobacter sabulilitoris]